MMQATIQRNDITIRTHKGKILSRQSVGTTVHPTFKYFVIPDIYYLTKDLGLGKHLTIVNNL